MIINPDPSVRTTTKGTLSGFDKVDLPNDNPKLEQTGWSIAQLQAYLLNQSEINFPTADQMIEYEQDVTDHVMDFNNPHQVTLDQIVGNFVEQVLGSIVPGTPPALTPFFAFDAVLAMPLGDIFPATYAPANLYRSTEGGVFINPAFETEIIGTDYSQHFPGIALFSQITNAREVAWNTNPATLINTQLSATTFPNLATPFAWFQVSETAGVGTFGIALHATEELATMYTLTLYIMPSVVKGKLIFSQPSDATNTMTVDLSDASFVLSSDQVQGSTLMDPSGMIRVSFSFTSGSPIADTSVTIMHENTGDNTTARLGVANRPLFSLAKPLITKAPRNQPVPYDGNAPWSTSPFAIDLSKIPAPSLMSSLLITLSLDIWPMLSSAKLVDTLILSFGQIQITRDQINIYVAVNGKTVFTSKILEGLNIITLSYSPSALIFKDLASPRQSVSGVYAAVPTSSVTIGPFAGYLREAAFYALADTLGCVEFLTNG
jgi:hypothetical protein